MKMAGLSIQEGASEGPLKVILLVDDFFEGIE